jgi:hypothetical protein
MNRIQYIFFELCEELAYSNVRLESESVEGLEMLNDIEGTKLFRDEFLNDIKILVPLVDFLGSRC